MSLLYPTGPSGYPVPPAPQPYCTDESILIRVPGDFIAICPSDQRMALGLDGVTDATGWLLTSPSVDFSTRGIQPGMVCLLSGGKPAIKPPGEAMIIASLSGPGLVLRRRGMASGVGDLPGGAANLTGLTFNLPTLLPQIRKASYDLNRRYGVDDLVYGRRQVDLFDPQEVEDACVLTVLVNQYFAQGRQTKEDTFVAKAAQCQRQLDDLLRRVEVLWRPSLAGPDQSGPFNTRVRRG